MLLAALLVPTFSARANPSSPGRHQTITVDVIQHVWWLTEWHNNEAICEIVIDHEGNPTRREVLEDCGTEQFERWIETPSCDQAEPRDCDGVYLHYIGSHQASQTVVVELPPASVELRLQGCAPELPSNRCQSLPTLLFEGIEPLPNHAIREIRGTAAGVTFHCSGNECELPVKPTHERGVNIVFWAASTFGDSSARFSARVRAVPAEPDGWYVDVLSPQYRGAPPASCAQTWQSLPTPGALPAWLITPDTPQGLATDEPYEHLAVQLVERGLVDTDHCPNLGFLAEGTLSACGMEAARPLVSSWQNRFDHEIHAVARSRNVPAQLLKSLFALESQFWPGLYQESREEFGFGQLTEIGADATLLWNRQFFGEFCPLVLSEGACSQGYSGLAPGEQALLRGALVREADASCRDCALGIDLSRADRSIEVFGETLLANCEQVGRMIRSTTARPPGDVASYQDLWRLTLANYHGGSGCVAQAIEATWQEGPLLHWADLRENLGQVCESVPDYVDRLSQH